MVGRVDGVAVTPCAGAPTIASFAVRVDYAEADTVLTSLEGLLDAERRGANGASLQRSLVCSFAAADLLPNSTL